MKHILLPTDFSETSFKAAVFALDLFGTKDVRYTLVHTYLKPAFSHVLLPRVADTSAMAKNGLRRAERRHRERGLPLFPKTSRLFRTRRPTLW